MLPLADTATVPEALGKVIVRSAVGSTTDRVISLVSSVAPSNRIAAAPCRAAVIVMLSVTALPIVVLPLAFRLPEIIVFPVSVLSPARVWEPVDTRPGLVASAV